MLPILLLPLIATWLETPAPSARWGEHGHRLAARAAVQTLPREMPAFFRAAEDQLSYLNPEPDRWRDRAEVEHDRALNEGFASDHWVHMDEVPVDLLRLQNRFEYVAALQAQGLDPEDVGTLSFTALELSQRLRSQFRRWRAETDPAAKLWIEERIINDAGILGHYITDGSNPHHTSMHHNGWVGENPHGFRNESGFHGRFEGAFVTANVTLEDVLDEVDSDPDVVADFRTAIINHVAETHSHLEELYRLDMRESYTATTRSPEHKEFAVERLSAGAEMLRDIWWSAWVTSATEPQPQPRR